MATRENISAKLHANIVWCVCHSPNSRQRFVKNLIHRKVWANKQICLWPMSFLQFFFSRLIRCSQRIASVIYIVVAVVNVFYSDEGKKNIRKEKYQTNLNIEKCSPKKMFYMKYLQLPKYFHSLNVVRLVHRTHSIL